MYGNEYTTVASFVKVKYFTTANLILNGLAWPVCGSMYFTHVSFWLLCVGVDAFGQKEIHVIAVYCIAVAFPHGYSYTLRNEERNRNKFLIDHFEIAK